MPSSIVFFMLKSNSISIELSSSIVLSFFILSESSAKLTSSPFLSNRINSVSYSSIV